jgi:uncharacterized protein (DUF1330 family)
MAAYVITQVDVSDEEKFKAYLKETPATIARHGGRYLARGGETILLEGNAKAARVVLIEFPSLQRAREWYDSEEYRRIKPLRAGAATASIIAVEGYSASTEIPMKPGEGG